MKIKIYKIAIRFSVKMRTVSRRTFKEAASSSFKERTIKKNDIPKKSSGNIIN
ncbi:hypothetical protein ES288_A07G032600v1 [Gossypium darwinii]|uniref:Uncharacterized protein n=1 Tax=Gossypium darwinii TaxID=34276 RepID=A0A5D2FVG4_GOSDA|nr:hypothetical protein ES288_A07G032600v1 [Gossypium darwinii]